MIKPMCVILFVAALFSGCAQPDMEGTFYLPAVTVHIVGSRDQIPSDDHMAYGYTLGREIWVLGRTDTDGKFYVDQGILGHELFHVLHHDYEEDLRYPESRTPFTVWGF